MKKLMFASFLLGTLITASFGVRSNKDQEQAPQFAPKGMVAYAASYDGDATSEPQWSTQNNKTFKYLNLGSTLNEYRGDSVKVGIIDSGINYDHEDFMVNSSTKVRGESKYYAYQTNKWVYYKASSHGYSYIDDSLGHGTNVAATVAAAINGVGGLGLAPNVELYVYKVTNSSNGYEFGAIQNALLDAKNIGLDVINMSFQSYEHAVSYGGSSMGASSGCSSILTYYLNLAYNAGITLVGAAGNYNTSEPSYPGSNNHVINVGSLNSSGTGKAGFSNYGSTIDLVAPGYVHVADEASNSAYTDTQGTSFSAPLVTAAIALYKQKHPSATPSEIEEALYASCDPISTDSQYSGWAGHGKLNVANFVGISPEEVPTEIVIPESEIELEIGETYQMNWTVNGVGNYDETVHFDVYTDAEYDVVSVNDKGKITALAEGCAIVSIISNVNPEVVAELWVEVTSAGSAPTVTNVEVNPSEIDLDLNGTKTANLSATVYGANNPSQTVSWESLDESVATVTNSGVVTAVGEGTTVIKATSTVDSTKYGTCTVDVVDSSPPIHRVVIERNEETGTITWTSSSATINGTKLLTVTNVENYHYESNSMRLGTNGGGGKLRIATSSGNIESIKLTCKAYSTSNYGTLTVGDRSINVNYTSYRDSDVLALNDPSDFIVISTPSKSVKVVLQSVIVNICVSEEDIGLTEDCVGLEDFITDYMHMDYIENLGYCSDSEHHYYSSAKAVFNSLNTHQRSLFTGNAAYELEWDRLEAWASANGESLNSNNQLASANNSVSFNDENNNSTILLIVIITSLTALTTCALLVIKKRRFIR